MKNTIMFILYIIITIFTIIMVIFGFNDYYSESEYELQNKTQILESHAKIISNHFKHMTL